MNHHVHALAGRGDGGRIAHVAAGPLDRQPGQRPRIARVRASTRTISPAASELAHDIVPQQARGPRDQVLHSQSRGWRNSTIITSLSKLAALDDDLAATRMHRSCDENLPDAQAARSNPSKRARERKQFLELPWEMNRRDPNWIPPLRQNQEELVGFRQHPFYDDAEGQTFLALARRPPRRPGAGAREPRPQPLHKENRGFFGFFECDRRRRKSPPGLFDGVRWWFGRGHHADPRADEPVAELRVRPLDRGLRFAADLHDDVQPAVLSAADRGLRLAKVEDMFAFWGHVECSRTLDKKLAFIVEECNRRFDIKLRRLDRAHFDREVRMFLDIYNQSLVGTWGFTPLSEGEVEHMAATLKHLIVPEMTTVAEIDGRPVGAQFGLLDYNPRIKQIDGRLFPFGFMRLLWNKKGDQAHPPDQHQRDSRVSEVGPGPGDRRPPGARSPGLGHRGSRILLGAGEQQPLLRHAQAGRGEDHEAVPAFSTRRSRSVPACHGGLAVGGCSKRGRLLYASRDLHFRGDVEPQFHQRTRP